jgi:hypothetical protein
MGEKLRTEQRFLLQEIKEMTTIKDTLDHVRKRIWVELVISFKSGLLGDLHGSSMEI